MSPRLLLDPTAESAGAQAAEADAAREAAPASASAGAEAARSAAAAPPPPKLELPFHEAQRLYEAARQLEELKVEQQMALEAERTKVATEAAEKAGIRKQFDEYRIGAESKAAALQAKYLAREADLVVAEAVAGRAFVSDFAAAQARRELAARVEARLNQDGSVSVLDRATGRPALDTLKAALDGAEFAHFRAATTRGGAGAAATGRVAETPETAAAAAPPKNMGEALIRATLAANEKARDDPYQPVGLGGRRGAAAAASAR